MKKKILLWLSSTSWLVILVVFCMSCNDPGVDLNSKIKTSTAVRANAEMLVTAQDVLDITGAGMVNQGITYGRVAHEEEEEDDDDHLCGATVTKSVQMDNSMLDSLIISGTISIDFGDGSQCGDSTERQHGGKITTEFTIHVNTKNHIYSSVETVTLENFIRGSKSMNGVFIAGAGSGDVRWLNVINAKFNDEGDDDDDGEEDEENESDDADSVRVTWTWNGSLTFTYDNNGTTDRSDDTKTITGSISATGDNGASFSSEITSAVTFKLACSRVPVMGTVNITNNGALTTLDFGNGTCDKIYTSTANGVVTELRFHD